MTSCCFRLLERVFCSYSTELSTASVEKIRFLRSLGIKLFLVMAFDVFFGAVTGAIGGLTQVELAHVKGDHFTGGG